jgi:tartrate-resistant acid phosphatase type 5
MGSIHEPRARGSESARGEGSVMPARSAIALLFVSHALIGPAGESPSPPGPPAVVRIAVIGDTGLGPTKGNQLEVARCLSEVAARDPLDFVLLLGDNFYPRGVSGIEDPQWDSAFESAYRLPHLDVAFVATLGNHDHHGNAQAQIDYARRDTRWHMEPFPYRFPWPKGAGAPLVECFAIDTEPLTQPGSSPQRQLRALSTMLESSTARWKLVFGHHPIFSDGPHGDTAELAPFRKLFLEQRVDAYLSGHDHTLQHLRPRDRLPEDRILYLVSGAGSSVYETKPSETSPFAASALGFLILDVTAESLRVRFFGLDRSVLYETEVRKGEAPAPREPAESPEREKTGRSDEDPARRRIAA